MAAMQRQKMQIHGQRSRRWRFKEGFLCLEREFSRSGASPALRIEASSLSWVQGGESLGQHIIPHGNEDEAAQELQEFGRGSFPPRMHQDIAEESLQAGLQPLELWGHKCQGRMRGTSPGAVWEQQLKRVSDKPTEHCQQKMAFQWQLVVIKNFHGNTLISREI